MKQELTPDAKRIIINWLRSGYYDLMELSEAGESLQGMTPEEIEAEIIRLGKCDPESVRLEAEAVGACAACEYYKFFEQHNGKEA